MLLSLALGFAILFVALVLLRRHHHRVARATLRTRERARPSPASHVDAWAESARRMDPQRVHEETSDTVDFDPRELGPEDIWPPDSPPPNGHGKHDPSGN